MENELFGEYVGYTSRKFTKQELLDIRHAIIEGTLIKDIARHYNVGEKAIRSIFRQFIMVMDSIKVYNKSNLGNKNESYYSTEEEMLQGIPNYKWKNLDRYEQQFYLNYERKFGSARNSRKNKTLE